MEAELAVNSSWSISLTELEKESCGYLVFSTNNDNPFEDAVRVTLATPDQVYTFKVHNDLAKEFAEQLLKATQ